MTRSLLPLLLTALAAILAAAATFPPRARADGLSFVVSAAGDDDNPGTRERPFQSLQRAQQAVRVRIAEGLRQDLTVRIRGGDYFLTEPLVFGPEDSGTEQHSVTWAAWPEETPRISGGRPITGWEAAGDGVWTVRLPGVEAGEWTFRELFVNGVRRPRARTPNEGYFRVVQAGSDKRTSFTFQPGDVRRTRNLEEVELVFLHDWSTSRVRLKDVDEEQHVVTLADPVGPNAPHYRMDHFEPNPRYFLENSAEFLDAPGEWFLDRRTGDLTYRPLPGETPETAETIAPAARELLVVRGDPASGRPVRNLHFIGLTLAHCAWELPKGGYAAGQASFHEARDDTPAATQRGFVPAAIAFELAEGCRFEDGRIERLGGSGILFGRSCRDCTLQGTVIADVAANGVMIGETGGRHVEGRSWWQSAPEQAARGNVVRNNRIEHCGAVFYGAVGVWIGLAADTTVAHNVIRHLPYTGVSVGWMWNPTPTPCGGNRIENNHIHHVMQVLSDGGGIYTLGRQPGTVLRGNLIHDVPLNLGRAESNGMFLDEGTTEIVIEDNVIGNVDRSPLRFHQARENLVRKNRFFLAPGVPPVRYNATDPALIRQEENEVSESEPPHPVAPDLLPDAGLERAYRDAL